LEKTLEKIGKDRDGGIDIVRCPEIGHSLGSPGMTSIFEFLFSRQL